MVNKDPIGIHAAGPNLFETDAHKAVADKQYTKKQVELADRVGSWAERCMDIKNKRASELENEIRMLKHHLSIAVGELNEARNEIQSLKNRPFPEGPAQHIHGGYSTKRKAWYARLFSLLSRPFRRARDKECGWNDYRDTGFKS